MLTRLYKPSAIVTVDTQVVTDLNLPPPAPRGPRISFRLRRTMVGAEPDTCDVSIWNLAVERELNMSLKFHTIGKAFVLLQAGYGAVVSSLFRGNVRRMLPHVRQGPDYATIIAADDAGDAISDLTVSYTTAGWTAVDMIAVAVARISAGDPLQQIDPYPLAQHPSVSACIAAVGLPAARLYTGVHAGKVTQLLDEAARILRCRWWIANNLLYMAQRGLPTHAPALAVVLPRKTWLGEPTPMEKGLVRVPVLFDPLLEPGRFVQLIGRTAPGVPEMFRCDAVDTSGDTRVASPWRCDLVLRRASLPGGA